ncbi:MAG TPA: DUF3618 domain-containing protein [Stellaceae bacterium]|nr:DUF3618 domain-containing protein [Stellaceae bacterium]
MKAVSPRTTVEIEAEIARTRVEIDHTLDGLTAELAPKHLVEKAANMFAKSWRSHGPSGSDLGEAVRADMAPLALIGLGAAWLVAEHTGFLDNIAPNQTDEGEADQAGRASRVGRQLSDRFKRNPLLFGLAGIVCGAVIAMLAPSSRREQELVAGAREDLWKTAEELGRRAADSIRAMATAPTDTTAED